MADFCMSPTENLLQTVPRDVYNMTRYYSTCTGTNPIDSSLSSAESLVTQTQTAITTILDNYCHNNTYLIDSLQHITVIDQVFSNITDLSSCSPNQEQLDSVLQDGLCTDTFKGIYVVWLAQFVCAAGILVCTVVVSIAYQYFPTNTANRNAAAAHLQTTFRPSEDEMLEFSNSSLHEERDAADIYYANTYPSNYASDDIPTAIPVTATAPPMRYDSSHSFH